MAKPTIEELERILAGRDRVHIEILPSGEIREVGAGESARALLPWDRLKKKEREFIARECLNWLAKTSNIQSPRIRPEEYLDHPLATFHPNTRNNVNLVKELYRKVTS